ncbi:YgiT-type zinc finger protein [Bacillus sp. BGMRC 2118]|nr:YgiT-type zinc finger protein [Bacillus sp. BGMRC 2118]
MINMGAVAEMVKCSCGGIIEEKTEAIRWNENGYTYQILNVPVLQCSNCNEELYPSDIQISISWIADEMRKNKLPLITTFKNIL